jgi:hypothetical protein
VSRVIIIVGAGDRLGGAGVGGGVRNLVLVVLSAGRVRDGCGVGAATWGETVLGDVTGRDEG